MTETSPSAAPRSRSTCRRASSSRWRPRRHRDDRRADPQRRPRLRAQRHRDRPGRSRTSTIRLGGATPVVSLTERRRRPGPQGRARRRRHDHHPRDGRPDRGHGGADRARVSTVSGVFAVSVNTGTATGHAHRGDDRRDDVHRDAGSTRAWLTGTGVSLVGRRPADRAASFTFTQRGTGATRRVTLQSSRTSTCFLGDRRHTVTETDDVGLSTSAGTASLLLTTAGRRPSLDGHRRVPRPARRAAIRRRTAGIRVHLPAEQRRDRRQGHRAQHRPAGRSLPPGRDGYDGGRLHAARRAAALRSLLDREVPDRGRRQHPGHPRRRHRAAVRGHPRRAVPGHDHGDRRPSTDDTGLLLTDGTPLLLLGPPGLRRPDQRQRSR